jgi:hypothetical protein
MYFNDDEGYLDFMCRRNDCYYKYIYCYYIPTIFNTVSLNKTLLCHPRFGVYTGVILSVNLITSVVFLLGCVSVCTDSFSLY